MRQGNNPLRLANAPTFIQPIALTQITHLPNREGYHAGRLGIVKASLLSMREHAGMRATVAIWDNGSCDELRDWLRYEYRPDMLILSENVGKTSARAALAGMFPSATVMACSDDDMFFYPNWLLPQLDILRVYPNVSVVTGYPVRTAFRWGVENTITWARKNARLEIGRFIPDQWEDDFAVSIGRNIDEHRRGTLQDIDYRVTWNGVKAFCTSHHCQFIAPVSALMKTRVFDRAAMQSEREFDVSMDKIGLRLATTERYTRHMGNVLHDELREEINQCSNILAAANS